MRQSVATQGELHECVSARSRESRSRLRHAASSWTLPNYDVGDFILVARVRCPGITPKLPATWTGPVRIVSIESPHLYQVQVIITAGTETVHVARLRLYSDSRLHIAHDLNGVFQDLWAQRQGAIAGIVNVADTEDVSVTFLVECENFEPEERTWE